MRKTLLFVSIIAIFVLSACGKSAPTVAATEPPGEEAVAPSSAPPPTDAATEAPTEPQASQPPAEQPALPAEPQEITFQASDGQELNGLYYPAAVNPAPVAVFMHWVNGDKSDWYELAIWLQNRGQANPFPNPGEAPWWDPTWFPAVPAERSYGVFIFSFRGCVPADAGCASWDLEGWLLDAQAAMLKATELEGVDPTRVVAIGSSIGADGAPDGCFWLNEQQPGSCKGALSLSPGGYLGIDYSQAVQTLGENQPPVAAWCLADESEFPMCKASEGVGNVAYRDFMIPTGQHGNMLLRPELDPLPMQIILDFLSETVD